MNTESTKCAPVRESGIPMGFIQADLPSGRTFEAMSNEEYAKENRELRRMIQRLKEQLTKALDELAKRRDK